MGVLWPAYLLLLAAIPLVVAAYLLVLRRRKRFAVHYSSLSLIRQAMPGGFRWRRHLPFALMVLAIALLVLALSRPFANVTVAASRTTIVLALDVSLSMCADDIHPNRLTVAQEAATRFIESQEPGDADGHSGLRRDCTAHRASHDRQGSTAGGRVEPDHGAQDGGGQRDSPLAGRARRGEPGHPTGQRVHVSTRRRDGPGPGRDPPA